MLYCPRCGVVLGEDASSCPLCGAVPVREKPASADAGGASYPEARKVRRSAAGGAAPEHDASASDDDRDESHPDVLTPAERRRIAVELLSVGFGVALAVTILADLFANRSLTWSLYAAVGIVASWLTISMPLILYWHPWVLFAVLAPSLTLLVFLLDLFDGRITWFLGYGLPILGAFAGVSAGTGAVVGSIKRKGLNAPAVFLCGIAALCFCVETVVDLNRARELSYDWSAVVAFALVPTAAFLFYLHYRIMNRASLRKLFRL